MKRFPALRDCRLLQISAICFNAAMFPLISSSTRWLNACNDILQMQQKAFQVKCHGHEPQVGKVNNFLDLLVYCNTLIRQE